MGQRHSKRTQGLLNIRPDTAQPLQPGAREVAWGSHTPMRRRQKNNQEEGKWPVAPAWDIFCSSLALLNGQCSRADSVGAFPSEWLLALLCGPPGFSAPGFLDLFYKLLKLTPKHRCESSMKAEDTLPLPPSPTT